MNVKQKYNIGEIVKYLNDSEKMNRYLVVATKNQPLNEEYIQKLKGELLIINIDRIAQIGIKVNNGSHYKIAKIETWKDKEVELSEMIDVFENDIEK